MRDSIWFVMTGILFALLGAVFINLGRQIWKEQKTELIISYHSERVSEENKKAYCTLFGSGILIMGSGFLISGICVVFIRTVRVFVPMAAGLVFGLAVLSSAIIKYNR